MIISYCVNPECPEPKNHPKLSKCNACGANLILNERYRVIKLLGKGGFGRTFVGVDLSIEDDDPLCVVKQLRPLTSDDKALNMALSLFQREAKTLARIDHPQIPKLMDYFVDGEEFYLIQELVNGQNLQRDIKQNGVWGELTVKRFLEEITPIIKYIHSQKVIHRDIKPANILKRKKDGQLILIDFGAVKDQVNTQLVQTYGQTALTKFAVGTMGYAPPEQLAMRPIYSSDIYALGATCLFLLTGKSPRKLERNPDTGELIWETEINISKSLGGIITKMLAPDTRQRYKTADELIEALHSSGIQQKLTDNLATRKGVSGEKPEDNGIDDSNSQLTANTSITDKLQKGIQQRKQKVIRNGKVVSSTQWTEERFYTAYNEGQKDYKEQDLSHLNLEGVKLNKFIFSQSNLFGVFLPSAHLYKADFYKANLQNANLQEANLSQAILRKSNLTNANLSNANLSGADLSGANLMGANLIGADLRNAQVTGKQISVAKVNWKTITPKGGRYWWRIF